MNKPIFDIQLNNKITLALKNLYVEIKSNNDIENMEKIRQIELEKLKDINPFDLIINIKEAVDINSNFIKEKNKNENREKSLKLKSDLDLNLESNSESEFFNDFIKENPYEDIIRKLEESKRNFIKVYL
jgi:hypothetical protein